MLHSLYSNIIRDLLWKFLMQKNKFNELINNNSDSSPNEKPPIETRVQIIQIVDSFYNKVRADELIGPIFNDVAKVDWDEHLPKLYNFWEDLILGSENYVGRPFPPHVLLDLKPEHFERWLKLFIGTIDQKHSGLKADEMKNRAYRIAYNFSLNLGLQPTPRVT